MDLALNNLESLICHKTQTNRHYQNIAKLLTHSSKSPNWTIMKGSSQTIKYFFLNPF